MTLTRIQEALLERARRDGHPLDPEKRDAAAVVLRAEVLVIAGMSGSEALARAREELLDSRPRRRPELVLCEVCGIEKPFARVAGFAYPRCGHRPIALSMPQPRSPKDLPPAPRMSA